MKLAVAEALGFVNSDIVSISTNAYSYNPVAAIKRAALDNVLKPGASTDKVAVPVDSSSDIPPSSDFYASYMDIKNNPGKYASLVNVPNILVAIKDAYNAQNDPIESAKVKANILNQLDKIYLFTNNSQLGEGAEQPSFSEIQGSGNNEDKMASAAATGMGIPIPPGAFSYVRQWQNYAKDKLWNSIRDAFDWGPGDNGKDMPNGGVVYFFKYYSGAARFGQPIIREKMSVGYFKSEYAPAIKKDTSNRYDYAEAEGLFFAYFPILRPGIDYTTQDTFWNKVNQLETIRKGVSNGGGNNANPNNAQAGAKSGNFNSVSGQTMTGAIVNSSSGFYAVNGHGLNAGDYVKINVISGDTSYNGVYLVQLSADDKGQNQYKVFTLPVAFKGSASGYFEFVVNAANVKTFAQTQFNNALQTINTRDFTMPVWIDKSKEIYRTYGTAISNEFYALMKSYTPNNGGGNNNGNNNGGGNNNSNNSTGINTTTVAAVIGGTALVGGIIWALNR